MTNPALAITSTNAAADMEVGFFQTTTYRGHLRYTDSGDTLDVTNLYGDIKIRPGAAGTSADYMTISPTGLTLATLTPSIILSDTTVSAYDGAIKVASDSMVFMGGNASGAPTTTLGYFDLNSGNFSSSYGIYAGVGLYAPLIGLSAATPYALFTVSGAASYIKWTGLNEPCKIQYEDSGDFSKMDFYGGADDDVSMTVVGNGGAGEVILGASLEANGSVSMTSNVSLTGTFVPPSTSNATEPSLSYNGEVRIWTDTDDSNRVYLVYRRSSGDQIKIELT